MKRVRDTRKPIRLGWLRPDTIIVGRYLNSKGHIYIRVKDHYLFGKGSWLLREHRLVMMEKIGRLLPRSIDVHHKRQWLRQFNHPDNLEMISHRDHCVQHSRNRSKQHRERLGAARTGSRHSLETKLRMSRSQKKRWKSKTVRSLSIRKQFRKY